MIRRSFCIQNIYGHTGKVSSALHTSVPSSKREDRLVEERILSSKREGLVLLR